MVLTYGYYPLLLLGIIPYCWLLLLVISHSQVSLHEIPSPCTTHRSIAPRATIARIRRRARGRRRLQPGAPAVLRLARMVKGDGWLGWLSMVKDG